MDTITCPSDVSGERLLDLTIPRESVKNKIRYPAGGVLRCGSGASPCGSHKVFVFTAVRKQAIEDTWNKDLPKRGCDGNMYAGSLTEQPYPFPSISYSSISIIRIYKVGDIHEPSFTPLFTWYGSDRVPATATMLVLSR